MEKIITYSDIPSARGESIYLRMETDPKLYISLLGKGYKLCKSIFETDRKTIYVTGRRQDLVYDNLKDYKEKVDSDIESSLKKENITKPHTIKFNY